MDFVTRLKQYIEYTSLPVSQFADTAQIPRPTLSQILNGRNKKISNEIIAKLHEGFPRLNIIWLLFGDGNMEVSPAGQDSVSPQNSLFGTNVDTVSDYEERPPYGGRTMQTTEQLHRDFGIYEATLATQGAQSQQMPASSVPNRQSADTRVYTQSAGQSANQPSDSHQHTNMHQSGRFDLNTAMSISPDGSKRVQSIMVFYTDNSFEIFTPAKN